MKLTQELHKELNLLCEARDCHLLKTLLPPIRSKTICVRVYTEPGQKKKFTFIHPSAGRSKFCYFHDKEQRLANEEG